MIGYFYIKSHTAEMYSWKEGGSFVNHKSTASGRFKAPAIAEAD